MSTDAREQDDGTTSSEDEHPTGHRSSESETPIDTMICPLCRERMKVPYAAVVISGFTVHARCAQHRRAAMDLAEIAFPAEYSAMVQRAMRYPTTAVIAEGGSPIVFLSDGAVYVDSYDIDAGSQWTELEPLPGTPAAFRAAQKK